MVFRGKNSLIQRKTVEPNDIDVPEGIVNKELDVNGSHSDKDHVVERGSSKSNNKGKTHMCSVSELKFLACINLLRVDKGKRKTA